MPMTDDEYGKVKAFDEGMKAHQEGKKKSDCPYPSGDKRQEWIDGFEVMVLSSLNEDGDS